MQEPWLAITLNQDPGVLERRCSQSFIARRWRGEVPMRTVLWRDMLGVGTAANVLATFVALMAISQGAPPWAALAVHLAPLPYNVFLLAAVWRASPRSHVASALSLIWLVLMTVV